MWILVFVNELYQLRICFVVIVIKSIGFLIKPSFDALLCHLTMYVIGYGKIEGNLTKKN